MHMRVMEIKTENKRQLTDAYIIRYLYDINDLLFS